MDNEDMIIALKENYIKIIINSIILFLLFPIIKWTFWSIIYILTQSKWVLDRFIESTFIDNIIPWYFDILIDFKESLALFILSFIIIWLVYGFMESFR